MIIQCEECESKFQLDDSMLKESGSKVRCSVCKRVFTVYPPEPDDEIFENDFSNMAMEETVALDLSGVAPGEYNVVVNDTATTTLTVN